MDRKGKIKMKGLKSIGEVSALMVATAVLSFGQVTAYPNYAPQQRQQQTQRGMVLPVLSTMQKGK
jgi:hypothetical protein